MCFGCLHIQAGEILEGVVVKTIPASKYAVFPRAGKLHQCLLDTWQKVWSMQLNRRFTADFELYSENCRTDNADVDVYIAILD